MAKEPIISFREALNIIDRRWGPNINLYERSVLVWILNRTYGFRKKAETIPIKHFLDGVRSYDGNVVCSGVGIGRTTLFEVLKSLVHHRLLLITGPEKRPRRYEILLSEPGKIEDELKLQKLSGGSPPGGLSCSSRALPKSVTRTTSRARAINNNIPREHRIFKIRKLNSPRSASGDKVEGLDKESAGRTSARFEQKLNDGNIQALERYFHNKVKEHWPDAAIPGSSPMDRGKLKHLVRGLGNVEPRAFLDYVIENWREIMKTQFKWMLTAPWLPEIGFILAHVVQFTAAYNKRNVNFAAPRKMSPPINGPDMTIAEARQISTLKKELAKAQQRVVEVESENQELHDRLLFRKARTGR